MDALPTVPLVVVTVVAAIVGVVDFRKFKVPNVLTVPLLISGIAYWAWDSGWSGVGDSLVGVLFGFGVLILFYAIGAVGAGDVKFLAGVGAWLGFFGAVQVFFLAGVATGIYGLAVLCWRLGLSRATATIGVTFMQLKNLGRSLGPAESVESALKRPDRRKYVIPFGTMVALAMVILLIWNKLV